MKPELRQRTSVRWIGKTFQFRERGRSQNLGQSDKMRHFSHLVEMTIFFRASSDYKDHLVDKTEFCCGTF